MFKSFLCKLRITQFYFWKKNYINSTNFVQRLNDSINDIEVILLEKTSFVFVQWCLLWNKIAENPNLLYEVCNIASVANKSFCQCITLEAMLFSANFLLHIAERMYPVFSILSILNISLQTSYHLPPLIRGIIRHLWAQLGTARPGISSAFSREQPSGTVGISWRGGAVIFIQF